MQFADRATRTDRVRSQPGRDGNPGPNGISGDEGVRVNPPQITGNSGLNVKILDVMEDKISAYLFLQNNTHQYQARKLPAEFSDVLFAGSYMSQGLISRYENMIDEITEYANSIHNLDKIGGVLIHLQKVSRDMILKEIVLELGMLNEQQKVIGDGFQRLTREKHRIQNQLPPKIHLALNEKAEALREHQASERLDAILDLAFSLIAASSSFGLGLTSAFKSFKILKKQNIFDRKTVDSTHLKKILEMTKSKEFIKSSGDTGTEIGGRGPVIIKAAKKLAKDIENIGCHIPDLIEKFSHLIEADYSGKSIEDLFGRMVEVSDLNELKRFENQRDTHQLQRMLHCVLSQNIDYQKEPSVTAQEVKNLIDEYFKAEDEILNLSEKYIINGRKIVILKQRQNYTIETNDYTPITNNGKQLEIISTFHEYMMSMIYHIASFASHLEYKYMQSININAKLSRIVSKPLKLPLRTNNLELKTIFTEIIEWNNAQLQEFDQVCGNRVHITIKDFKTINDMVLYKNSTVTIPLAISELPKNTTVHEYFSSHSNIRVQSMYSTLDFNDEMKASNMPSNIWMQIEQFPLSKQVMSDKMEMFLSSNTLTISKRFNITQQSDIEMNLVNFDCCLDDCGQSSKSTFCPSPFSTYNLIVPLGNQRTCPQTEPEKNCKGISLEGLNAIDIYFNYCFISEKNA